MKTRPFLKLLCLGVMAGATLAAVSAQAYPVHRHLLPPRHVTRIVVRTTPVRVRPVRVLQPVRVVRPVWIARRHPLTNGVMTRDAYLWPQPNKIGPRLQKVRRGKAVEVEGRQNGFYAAVIPNDRHGWLPCDAVRRR